jgi:hypothetical protein
VKTINAINYVVLSCALHFGMKSILRSFFSNISREVEIPHKDAFYDIVGSDPVADTGYLVVIKILESFVGFGQFSTSDGCDNAVCLVCLWVDCGWLPKHLSNETYGSD